MLADETIPGFIYMETPETFEQMIHPNDQNRDSISIIANDS